MFVERAVDASAEVLGFLPDRIGPITATRLFGEVLPRTLIAPKVVLRSARKVAEAWIAWVAASGELSWRARLRLRLRRMFLVQVMFDRTSCQPVSQSSSNCGPTSRPRSGRPPDG